MTIGFDARDVAGEEHRSRMFREAGQAPDIVA